MGLGTGLKLGQKIVTAWTKTGTSNNLIAMKPVKINIEELKLAPSLRKNPETILDIKSNIKEPKSLNKLESSEPTNLKKSENFAFISAEKEKQGLIAFGVYPSNYVALLSREFVEAKPERISRFLGKERRLKAVPAHYEETYKFLPHYYIKELWSRGKGSGTCAVQNVVRKSLEDIETQGRVLLNADCIDGKTYPAGFYYKLGFRFPSAYNNEMCQTWLNNGGLKSQAPAINGMMYLPKENVDHCLRYGTHPIANQHSA